MVPQVKMKHLHKSKMLLEVSHLLATNGTIINLNYCSQNNFSSLTINGNFASVIHHSSNMQTPDTAASIFILYMWANEAESL